MYQVFSDDRSIKTVLERLYMSLYEVFMLRNAGFRVYSTFNASWYISAMLLTMLACYPLLLKFKKTYLYVIAPLVAIFVLGYMNHESTGLANVSSYMGLLYKCQLRAIAEINLGVVLYAVARKLKTVHFSKFGIGLISLIELAGYAQAFWYMCTIPKFTADFVMLALLAVAVYLLAFAICFDTFQIGLYVALYNLLLSLPLLGLLLMAVRRFPAAVIAAALAAFIVFYVDSFVYSVRLTHIRFSDFMQTGQALRVANRYSLIWNWELTRRLAIVAVLCALLVLVRRYYRLEYKKRTVFFTGLGLTAIGLAVLFSGILPHNPEGFDFTTEAEQNGLIYSWYGQYMESRLEEPEGYTRQRAEEILSVYQPTEGEPGA